jgi:hypothetical protein
MFPGCGVGRALRFRATRRPCCWSSHGIHVRGPANVFLQPFRSRWQPTRHRIAGEGSFTAFSCRPERRQPGPGSLASQGGGSRVAFSLNPGPLLSHNVSPWLASHRHAHTGQRAPWNHTCQCAAAGPLMWRSNGQPNAPFPTASHQPWQPNGRWAGADAAAGPCGCPVPRRRAGVSSQPVASGAGSATNDGCRGPSSV